MSKFADGENAAVRTVDLATGQVKTLLGVFGQRGIRLGQLPAGLNRPAGIAFTSTGTLFISDQAENTVLVLAGRP